MNRVFLLLRLASAAILLQTLFFKFTAAPESVWIFSTLGIEPWGRIGSGVAEAVAAVLLLIAPTAHLGALLTLGLMSGALLSHVFVLGIAIQNDGGLLFGLAVTVWLIALAILVREKDRLTAFVHRFRPR